MPFEFGIFYSAKWFGKGKHKNKQCIVMEKGKHRYQKFISDISGIDVTPHGNSVKSAISALRNWLVTASRRTSLPPAEQIYPRYLKFKRVLEKVCKERGIDHRTMPFVEMVQNMTDWLKVNQALKQPLFA